MIFAFSEMFVIFYLSPKIIMVADLLIKNSNLNGFLPYRFFRVEIFSRYRVFRGFLKNIRDFLAFI